MSKRYNLTNSKSGTAVPSPLSSFTLTRLENAIARGSVEVESVIADKRLSLEEAARKVVSLESELQECRQQLSGQFGNVVRLRAEASEAAMRAATEAIASRESTTASLSACVEAQRKLIEGLKADLELERGYSDTLKRELSAVKGGEGVNVPTEKSEEALRAKTSALSLEPSDELEISLKRLASLETERALLVAERDFAVERLVALEASLESRI